MQVAKKNPAKTAAIAKAVAASKAKTANKHHSEKGKTANKHHADRKINNSAEYKKAVKASRHFLRQLTMFNGFSTKLSKSKLGDKKILLNARSSMNKMSKLWEEYEKACGKLHMIEKNFSSHSNLSNLKKPAAKKPGAKKTTAKKTMAKKPAAKKVTAKKTIAKKPGVKKTAAKKSNIVKMTKKPASKAASN